VHILLAPHVVNMDPLMFDHWSSLWVNHSLVPILMKEGPESLISAPLLRRVVVGPVVESDQVHWVLLGVIHNFSVGVSDREPDLQALKLFRRLRSATMRRGILGRGVLLITTGSSSLSELLVLGGGSTA
jgi:hypothetical protein